MDPVLENDGALSARELKAFIVALEARLAALKKRLPAHSIPPAMIVELDELDEQLAQARQRLAALEQPKSDPERRR